MLKGATVMIGAWAIVTVSKVSYVTVPWLVTVRVPAIWLGEVGVQFGVAIESAGSKKNVSLLVSPCSNTVVEVGMLAPATSTLSVPTPPEIVTWWLAPILLSGMV